MIFGQDGGCLLAEGWQCPAGTGSWGHRAAPCPGWVLRGCWPGTPAAAPGVPRGPSFQGRQPQIPARRGTPERWGGPWISPEPARLHGGAAGVSPSGAGHVLRCGSRHSFSNLKVLGSFCTFFARFALKSQWDGRVWEQGGMKNGNRGAMWVGAVQLLTAPPGLEEALGARLGVGCDGSRLLPFGGAGGARPGEGWLGSGQPGTLGSVSALGCR